MPAVDRPKVCFQEEVAVQDDLILMEKTDSVCTISLNRPERRNALCMELLQQLVEAIDATNDDPSYVLSY